MVAAAKKTLTTGRAATPRIYVASLSDYNAGRLHGVWLDALDADEVEAGIDKMLAASPSNRPLLNAQPPTQNAAQSAADFAIHDFENFGSYRLGEYDSIPLDCALGAAIQEHGALFADYLG